MTTVNLSNLTAIILAGGLGTRLRSVVSDRPKVLARVLDRPFLMYQLDQLAAAGLNYVILCTGYLGEQVKAEFGTNYTGLQLAYSQEQSPLGTAGALQLALPLIHSDLALVLNGDSYCDVDLRSFYSWSIDRMAPGSLVLTHVPDTARYGKVETDTQDRIVQFKEKAEAGG